MRKSSNISRIFVVVSVALLIALTIPMIKAQTVTITAGPDPLMPGDSVTVEGMGFAASSAVAIGIGEEVTVTGELHEIPEPAGNGPFIAIVNNYPIKPGSFSFHCDVSGVTSDYYDDYSNGTLNTSSTYAVDPFVNYVTGEFGRSTNSPWDGYTVTFTANYTYYQNATTVGLAVTDAEGTFTDAIIVPENVVNGNYTITVIDELGNFATSAETFEKVPEDLTFGVMTIVTSVAGLAGSRYILKRSKKRQK